MKADFTARRISAEDIFSRFKALKLSEGFSKSKWFKTSSRYLIFDDTILPKTGKRMEKIG